MVGVLCSFLFGSTLAELFHSRHLELLEDIKLKSSLVQTITITNNFWSVERLNKKRTF